MLLIISLIRQICCNAQHQSIFVIMAHYHILTSSVQCLITKISPLKLLVNIFLPPVFPATICSQDLLHWPAVSWYQQVSASSSATPGPGTPRFYSALLGTANCLWMRFMHLIIGHPAATSQALWLLHSRGNNIFRIEYFMLSFLLNFVSFCSIF